MSENPLLRETWDRPFALPPFDEITEEDFVPAYDCALEKARKDIRAIAENPEPPDFANTIEAMERADRLLDRIGGVFWNFAGTVSTSGIEELERELSPRLTAFESEVLMNPRLFSRVKDLKENGDSLDLSDEQRRVLELYFRMFVRAGAALDAEGRERLATIMERLAELGTAFSQNLLADERDWTMPLIEEDLKDSPDFVRSAAEQAARERDRDGFIMTLSRSQIVPFLQNCPRRDLRKRAYEAWTARGRNGGDTDNRAGLLMDSGPFAAPVSSFGRCGPNSAETAFSRAGSGRSSAMSGLGASPLLIQCRACPQSHGQPRLAARPASAGSGPGSSGALGPPNGGACAEGSKGP